MSKKQRVSLEKHKLIWPSLQHQSKLRTYDQDMCDMKRILLSIIFYRKLHLCNSICVYHYSFSEFSEFIVSTANVVHPGGYRNLTFQGDYTIYVNLYFTMRFRLNLSSYLVHKIYDYVIDPIYNDLSYGCI